MKKKFKKKSENFIQNRYVTDTVAPKLAVAQSSAVSGGAAGADSGQPFPPLQASPEVTATGMKIS